MSETNFKYKSCNATRLYEYDNFPEDNAKLLDLINSMPAGEYICELFPNYKYERRFSDENIITTATFKDQLRLNREFIQKGKSGAASAIFKLHNVIIRDRVIYVKNDSTYSIIYETHRPCDRYNSSLAARLELDTAPAGAGEDEICLVMGSTGCFNYGHWVSDDLTRMSAFWSIRSLHPDKHIVIVITAHNSRIDDIKKESIDFILSSDKNFSIRVFARPTSVFFKSIYYASPASYPGALKSPEAVGYLHVAAVEALMRRRPAAIRNYMRAFERSGSRIFVDRGRGHSRALINATEIYDRLERHGFEYVDPENLSFAEQVEIFSRASIVVGNMGAGMTNTIFCRPNSCIIYLAPEGWDDAFFWDLAAVMNHCHHAIYGAPKDLCFSSGYSINPRSIEKLMQELGL